MVFNTFARLMLRSCGSHVIAWPTSWPPFLYFWQNELSRAHKSLNQPLCTQVRRLPTHWQRSFLIPHKIVHNWQLQRAERRVIKYLKSREPPVLGTPPTIVDDQNLEVRGEDFQRNRILPRSSVTPTIVCVSLLAGSQNKTWRKRNPPSNPQNHSSSV